MDAIKGLYKNGIIELQAKPMLTDPVEVLVIFPDSLKKVKKIFGLFKDAEINYDEIEKDLHELDQLSTTHLMDEFRED